MIHHTAAKITAAAQASEAVTLTSEEVAELAPFINAAHQIATITLEAAEFERRYRSDPPKIFADRMEQTVQEILAADLNGEAGAKALAAELGLEDLAK